jgi:hypothetical protein
MIIMSYVRPKRVAAAHRPCRLLVPHRSSRRHQVNGCDRSSASFDAAERASRTIQPVRRTNIRHSMRRITSPRSCQPWDTAAAILAGQPPMHLLEPRRFPAFLAAGADLELPRGPSADEDPVAAWQVHSDGVQAVLDDPETALRQVRPAGRGARRCGYPDQAAGFYRPGPVLAGALSPPRGRLSVLTYRRCLFRPQIRGCRPPSRRPAPPAPRASR